MQNKNTKEIITLFTNYSKEQCYSNKTITCVIPTRTSRLTVPLVTSPGAVDFKKPEPLRIKPLANMLRASSTLSGFNFDTKQQVEHKFKKKFAIIF